MKKVLFFVLCLHGTLWAQNYTALRNTDTVDANVGDGTCADAQGHCSLRAAIMEANADSNHNTISLVRGTTYKITRPNVSNLDSDGDFDVTENVTIQIINPHIPIQSIAELPTIDADGLDRVFHIDGADFVTFDGLRIINGDATTNGYLGGGAVMVESGVQSFTLNNSVIEMNEGSIGAALHLMGDLTTINNSDLSLNTNTTQGGQVNGGAIYQGAGNLLIHRSSLHHNGRTDGEGGCIYAVKSDFNASSLIVMNSTIAHNGGSTSSDCIGGISALNSVAIFNSLTVIGNAGRGIHYYDDPNDADDHFFTMRNSLLDNDSQNCNFPAGDVDTGDASSGHNISSDNSCQFMVSNDNGNLNATALELHPGRGLYAGGYHWFQEPLPGSPAIENGSTLDLVEKADVACSPTDQVSRQRNYDGDGDQTAICDSGAVEYNGDLLFYSGLE